MTSRELRFRNFAVRIEVPDRIGRSRNGQASSSSLVVEEPPPVRLQPRSIQRALDAVRAPELEGDGKAASAAAIAHREEQSRRAAAATTLEERIALHTWYHTVELPGGVVTPGFFDHRTLLPFYGMPERLDGQRALDVACFDGYWTFEMERRGAVVTALDAPRYASYDLPADGLEVLLAEGFDQATGAGFRIAKEALGSAAERLELNVYDLSPETAGTFDLVHVGDLLLHLAKPVEALRRIRSVTRGRLILADVFERELADDRRQLWEYRGGWQNMVWWLPSLESLVQAVSDVGFEDVRVHKVYRLGDSTGAHGFWRAVIHARG
jgi:tRNA (mo5U34)-methyltransferase